MKVNKNELNEPNRLSRYIFFFIFRLDYFDLKIIIQKKKNILE